MHSAVGKIATNWRITNIFFQIIEGNFTWGQAEADAQIRGGRLAVLNTQAKIDSINRLMADDPPSRDTWIGLRDVGNRQWQWVSGEPLGASNWAPGEPNDHSEKFVMYFGTQFGHNRFGQWNDAVGWELCNYILE